VRAPSPSFWPQQSTGNMEIRDFFAPGGLLSACLSNYEHRPQQLEMAEMVARAIREGRHAIVEAGTGVGKSLAYLLPAYLHARQSKLPAVVSTYTINLQEQLVRKDIPLLEAALGEKVSAAAAMGRRNYLCLKRLAAVFRSQATLFDDDAAARDITRIQEWAFETKEGSLSDLDFAPRPSLWELVSSNRFTCSGRNCNMSEACFYRLARQRLRQAQIVVANHYLYFTDLASSNTEQRIIPPHSCAIFDEAHTIEDVACECLGISTSQKAVRFVLDRLSTDARRGGILASSGASPGLSAAAAELRDRTDGFFHEVREWAEHSAPGNMRITEPLPLQSDVAHSLRKHAADLIRFAEKMNDENLAAEISGCATELSDHAGAMEIVSSMSLEGHVYWVEREKNDTHMKCAPVRVAGLLSQVLFPALSTAVLTGATLAVGGNSPFAFVRERLGLEKALELQLGSPFDYASQATIFIERNIPPPENENYVPALTQAMKHYLRESRGRALVLFTSYENMRTIAERLTPFLEEQGCRVLIQGSGLSRARLLDIFKTEVDSVLFGTSSFWQGVDVPGESLSSVIIAHLPFAVPTQPLQQARLEEMKRRGQNSFEDYSLPQAIIRLRQGVGRLIRSRTDTGHIVLLDSRVATRRYGRRFVESLPPCRVVTRD
jgi:ATP-dependent DNA helicase DinG